MKIEIENGYIQYSIEEDEIIIDNIKVFRQRQGTGRMLIDKIKDISLEKNLPIGLYAEPQDDTISEDELRQFYFNLGFDECGQHRNLFTWKR